jgi:hypothetical protein
VVVLAPVAGGVVPAGAVVPDGLAVPLAASVVPVAVPVAVVPDGVACVPAALVAVVDAACLAAAAADADAASGDPSEFVTGSGEASGVLIPLMALRMLKFDPSRKCSVASLAGIMPARAATSRIRSLELRSEMLACSLAFCRSSTAARFTASPMPVFIRSIDTCMKTIPIKPTPTIAIHARPRMRRSMRRCSDSAWTASMTRNPSGRGAVLARLALRFRADLAERAGPEIRRGPGAVAGERPALA